MEPLKTWLHRCSYSINVVILIRIMTPNTPNLKTVLPSQKQRKKNNSLLIIANESLYDRIQEISSKDFRSSPFTLYTGVPQRRILGPFLFTLYKNNSISATQNCNAYFYADDTVLFATGSSVDLAIENIQSPFEAFQKSFITHELVLNSGKTKCLPFIRTPESIQPVEARC